MQGSIEPSGNRAWPTPSLPLLNCHFGSLAQRVQLECQYGTRAQKPCMAWFSGLANSVHSNSTLLAVQVWKRVEFFWAPFFLCPFFFFFFFFCGWLVSARTGPVLQAVAGKMLNS